MLDCLFENVLLSFCHMEHCQEVHAVLSTHMLSGCCLFLNTQGKLLSVKNTAGVQFLTQTGTLGTYYHTLFKGP
jgi:hypothetical protein